MYILLQLIYMGYQNYYQYHTNKSHKGTNLLVFLSFQHLACQCNAKNTSRTNFSLISRLISQWYIDYSARYILCRIQIFYKTGITNHVRRMLNAWELFFNMTQRTLYLNCRRQFDGSVRCQLFWNVDHMRISVISKIHRPSLDRTFHLQVSPISRYRHTIARDKRTSIGYLIDL